jgi:hypothetical protein
MIDYERSASNPIEWLRLAGIAHTPRSAFAPLALIERRADEPSGERAPLMTPVLKS